MLGVKKRAMLKEKGKKMTGKLVEKVLLFEGLNKLGE